MVELGRGLDGKVGQVVKEIAPRFAFDFVFRPVASLDLQPVMGVGQFVKPNLHLGRPLEPYALLSGRTTHTGMVARRSTRSVVLPSMMPRNRL